MQGGDVCFAIFILQIITAKVINLILALLNI